MSNVSLLLFGLAAAGGVVLWVTRGGTPRLPGRRWVAPAHGLTAAAGLVLLVASGTSLPAQAWTAAAVLAATAAGGLALRWLQRSGRRPTADLLVWGHALGALLGVGLLLLASRA